ncbi:hypothetical protein [Paenibacillus sp. Y412MC10]|uniref:hypothetical protein n=1 Tax=Geobacillus sp. (strain Y412MC10) TaxID=481743 RepID=UPI0011AB72FD|nr:hypothetical protein [Paenibacillus sp. Y412MC10]
MNQAKDLVFSSKYYWNEIEESMLHKDGHLWSLYKRLPNTLKLKIRDERKQFISNGLSDGLMSDASYVLECAIDGADLFGSIIGADVLGTTDKGEEIKGTIGEVDTDTGAVVIQPYDVQNCETSLPFDQLTFLTDGLKPANVDVLSFDEAWNHYEAGSSILSHITLIIYNPANEIGQYFSPMEIRGGWTVIPTVLEREDYIQFLLEADDDVMARFTGKSIDTLKRRESEGTLGDLLTSVYDSMTEDQLRTFEIEWF